MANILTNERQDDLPTIFTVCVMKLDINGFVAHFFAVRIDFPGVGTIEQ